MDCGPLCLNSKMVNFGRWLVDSGHCKFFVLIFHEQRHSKGDADGDFGHMTVAMETEVQLGPDCIGHTVDSLPRVELRFEFKMRAHIASANAKCDFDAHESGLYKFVGGLGKKKDNIHLIVIGHEYVVSSSLQHWTRSVWESRTVLTDQGFGSPEQVCRSFGRRR